MNIYPKEATKRGKPYKEREKNILLIQKTEIK